MFDSRDTLVVVVSLLLSSMLAVIVMIPIAYAEQLISIVPGASDQTRPRFFDITFYPIKTGNELVWHNDDNTDHRLVIKSESGSQIVDSGVIRSNSSFSYKFNQAGMYHFSSPTYPWMQGDVLATDDISTARVGHLKNNVDVGLTWSPSTPRVGQITHFILTFVNAKTSKNQEHIDYGFTINGPTGKTVYSTGFSRHSSGGIEPLSYKFGNAGKYTDTVTIYGVLFQTVDPDQANFTMTAKP